jgi:putative glutamine amidotransferase
VFISQRVDLIGEERRDSYSQEWNDLAKACDFLPIFIPNNINIVKKMLMEIKPDAIILSGGNDLVEYGGTAPERDMVEKYLIDYAEKNSIPLLGVCRGMQMILNYYGVSLEKVNGHVRTNHILTNGLEVNSFHNWAAQNSNKIIKVIERSEDGCIEEIEHVLYRDIHGIMWHPERYKPFRDGDLKFIRRCLKL